MVGAGVNTAAAPAVPVAMPINLCLQLNGTETDFAGEHVLRVKVRDPDMNVVNEQAAPFEAAFNGQEGHEGNYIIPLGVIFNAESYGQYTIELSVDDRTYSVPWYVIEAPPPA